MKHTTVRVPHVTATTVYTCGRIKLKVIYIGIRQIEVRRNCMTDKAARPLPALVMPRNIWKVTFSRVEVKKEITRFAFRNLKQRACPFRVYLWD